MTTMIKTEAKDIAAQKITDTLLAMMGDGSDKAMKLWRASLASFTASGMPYNADTGKPYSGGNVFSLMIARNAAGHESNGWITLTNMAKRGYTIRKGCKAPWAWVLSPMLIVEKKDATGKPVLGADGKGIRFNTGRQRAYKVFNMSCVETNGKKVPGNSAVVEPGYDGMAAILAYHKPVIEPNTQAFYRPKADTVHMPAQSAFTTEQAYYHVLAHELSHWTGNPKRLNRDQSAGFGSEGYAFEELIAELSAAFTMARLGMGESQMPHHANYLKSWIGALKNDKGYIMKAASKASAASAYLVDPIMDGGDVPAAE